jgi:sugar lactone lactonase YvrE
MLKKVIPLAGIFLVLTLFAGSAQINYNDVTADKHYRDGVLRFHEGQYGEAVLFFQKTLELRPQDILARTWLGRSYFHAGFEDVALMEWDLLVKDGAASLALGSFTEYLRSLQGLGTAIGEDQDFFPVHLVGSGTGFHTFRRPSAVLPLSNGQTLVASFASNSLVVMDANGQIKMSYRGGLQRLQGPFDMTLVGSKRLYVTQFLSNQVFEMTLDGNVLKVFGEKGIGAGQLLGPQYICNDGLNYLYVSDSGNRRIQKFDLDGNPILTIGERSSNFDGLERPTGVFFQGGLLYVLDARRKSGVPRIVVFDESGNLVDYLEDPRLVSGEGLGEFEAGELLVATRDALLRLDLANLQLHAITSTTRPLARFTKAVQDANGHLVAADFDAEKIELYSRLAGLYSGLHVQVQRINARDFPRVRVDLSVSDNVGRPIVGLDEKNFQFFERQKSVSGLSFLGAGYRENRVDAMVIVESSPAMANDFNREALGNALNDLRKELPSPSTIGVISAGMNPVVEVPLSTDGRNLGMVPTTLPIDMDWAFDKGLRLAVPELVKAAGIRHIIYIGNSSLPESAFETYGLQETLSYLRNNQIRFSVISLQDQAVDPALQFLQRETGGFWRQLYAPRGLGDFGRQLREAKDGTYSFAFNSSIDSDFGRKYLPLEVAVQLFQKSGRDELGYFAPLSY